MNNDRRKQIAEVSNKLEELAAMLRDEEQEYYDNMPESFQDGEKGSAADEAIDQLQSAEDDVLSAISNLESIH